MLRVGSDVSRLLQSIGVSDMNYVEVYLEQRASIAVLRWKLLTEVDCVIAEAHGFTTTQQPIFAPVVEAPMAALMNLPLIGATTSFAVMSRVNSSESKPAEAAKDLSVGSRDERRPVDGATIHSIVGQIRRRGA